ncbi:MAG: hypothetical protein ACREBD_34610, partial [Blastocatellia bacterium]
LTPDDITNFRKALDEILLEMKLSFERMRLMNEQAAKDWAEIERLKQETQVIHARIDKFMDAHFGK